MKDTPLISCVIPTYNRSQKVIQAIESVLGQSYSNLEVLVVDDQSKDDTRQVVEKLAQGNPRIKYFYNPSKGANNARNHGIQNAQGEFIAMLDDDDRWDKLKLEKQLQAFNKLDSNYGVVYCTFARKKNNGKILRTHPSRFSSSKNGDILKRLLKRNFITTSTILVKTEVFKKSGLFNPRYKSFQDWELLTRIARDYYFYHIPEVLVNVYESGDSITLDKHGRVITKYMHLKQFLDLYEGQPKLLSKRYSSLGFTLFKLKRNGFARLFLKRSLKYNPLNPEALFLLLILSLKRIF